MLKYIDEKKLVKIIKKYYQGRDKSHGIDHVILVYKNTKKITKNIKISDRYKAIVFAAALLHDAYDHKYVKEKDFSKIITSIKKDLLSLKFTDKDCKLVFKIMDNISYSKEKKLRKKGIKINLGRLQKYRNIVSDADKLEALDSDGVIRMIHYYCHQKPNAKIEEHIKHIRDHCDEKLYILIKEKYIRTRIGRELAKDRLLKLKKIVDNDKVLIRYITKHSKNACK